MSRKLTLELSWTLDGERHWLQRVIEDPAFIPREGDAVELADGWSGEPVQSTILLANGDAHVRLRVGPLDREQSVEMLTLVEHGWTDLWPKGDPE